MKRVILIFIFVMLSVFLMGRDAKAVPITTGGTPIIVVDGNTDSNVTVDILSVGGTSTYTLGYFLNSGSTFNPLGPVSIQTFNGGNVIDFALYDGARYYTLSGDVADSLYSVTMGWTNEVTSGSPQQPAGWTNPYYYNVNITWTIGGTGINTNEYALNLVNNGNDGVAPVPEPSSLLLLGSGLVGFGILMRRSKRKN